MAKQHYPSLDAVSTRRWNSSILLGVELLNVQDNITWPVFKDENGAQELFFQTSAGDLHGSEIYRGKSPRTKATSTLERGAV